MGLKPSKWQAVLVQERVQEAIHDNRLPDDERALLEEFNTDLERYLR